jgi:hypothetical protein
MLILQGLVAIAALGHTATAFFLWVPEYRCAEFHTCSTDADVKGRDLDNTLKIVQRLPKVIYQQTVMVDITNTSLEQPAPRYSDPTVS